MTQPSNGLDATLVLCAGSEPEDQLPLLKEALADAPSLLGDRFVFLDPLQRPELAEFAERRGWPPPFPLPRPSSRMPPEARTLPMTQ